MAEPCTDCPQEFAADEELLVDASDGPDPRGTTVTKWGPALLAPIGKPTGDKRRFASGALTNRELPLPLKWQRQDGQGHSGSVVVGTLDGIDYDEDGAPWGFGLLFNPDPAQLPRLAEDVAEARLLLEQKVNGPSVDLDDMEFHQIDPADAGQYAAEARPDIEVTRGRISAGTLVPIPAFAEARPFPLTEMDPAQYAAELEAYRAEQAPSVRASGWADLPVAGPEVAWEPANAVARLREWAADDTAAYAQGFLWSDGERQRFPVADVIDGQLTLVPAALEVAASVLAGGQVLLAAADAERIGAVVSSMLDDLVPDGAETLAGALAHLDASEFAELGDLAEELAGAEEGTATYGARFDALKAKLAGKVSDPGAVAASIGRKKYGKKGMAKLRAGAAASKVKPLKRAADDHDYSYAVQEAMVAAAALNQTADAALPAAWFTDPKLTGPTPLTVTADGRVFGHLAAWGTCHTAYANTCVTPPKSRKQYAYFHTGAVDTDGGEVAVGRISIGGGHADTRYGFQAAAEHYDSTSTAAAVVRAGEDKYGIWVAGAALPGADLAELKRSPLSGDWRRIGGQLELVHALAVNSGGFPIPRASMVAGAQMALVAAGVMPAEDGRPAQTFVPTDVEALVLQAVQTARRAESNFARALAAFARIDDAAEASEQAARQLRATRAVRRIYHP